MANLINFVTLLNGKFDNKDQFNKMQAEGKIISICGTCKYNL